MKLKSIILTIVALCGFSMQAASLPSGFFARQSKLSKGNWVKVGVSETGVYEISYETLRAMGFSDPSKVGVYGRGGRQLDYNFLSAGGQVLYHDDLEQVAVYHYNDKIYFYGVGTKEVSLRIYSTMYEGGGYFSRSNNNIYANIGYYFLSDSETPKIMEYTKGSSATPQTVTKGIAYKLHEDDLVHNNSETGQLFFGEKLSSDRKRINWDLFLPGAIDKAQGAMECYFYLDRLGKGESLILSYGFEGTTDFTIINTTTASSSNFTPQTPTVNPMTIPGSKSRAFVNLDVDFKTDVSHIDYWVVTYQRNIPDLIGQNGLPMAQDFIAFPKMYSGLSSYMCMPGGANFKVFDISNTDDIKLCEVTPDGADGVARINCVSTLNRPQLMVFDPMQPQLQIRGFEAGYEKIANQDLHGRLSEGADMVIICVPELRDKAERLARVHAEKDGVKVVVATTEECYNEFSSGRPDPMAYRAAVRMAYAATPSCRNVLLMGPLYADFRGIINEKHPEEGIIAYQSIPMNQERGAYNVNDFYGQMDDYINSNKDMELLNVQVGVAILPTRFPEEVDLFIDKVERYLDYEDFAYVANMMTSIGGVEDDHTHEKQSTEISSYINGRDNGATIMTPLITDAYGYNGAHNKLFSDFNEGRLLMNYFGHGAPQLLNHSGNLFNAPHVFQLRNEIPPFFSFAGCDLSNPDRGIRGLGETVVTSTPYGCIGTLSATRETWSGQNMQFYRLFYGHLFGEVEGSKVREYAETPTIGQVYAKTKSSSDYTNELAYQLICDPSLRIPVATRKVVLDNETPKSVPGERFEISGYVPMPNDAASVDGGFNGTVVIRMMEPYETILSNDLVTGSDPNAKHDFKFIKADVQATMTSAEVKNGRFTAELFIPERATDWVDKICRLHVAAYSPSYRVTAGKMFPMEFSISATETSQSKDNIAPSIDVFEFDPQSCSLDIKVTDNLAMGFNTSAFAPDFKMTLDGADSKSAGNIAPKVFDGGKGYTKNVILHSLKEGMHIAKLMVKDAAGNESTREIIFTYLPSTSKYAIRLIDGVARDGGVFEAVAEAPASADIVILSSDGTLVRREAFKNSRYEWDGLDLNGNKVAKGLYKAYIIETGTSGSKGESQTIDVPVI